jgi:Holliday junction resolvase RusA-like endonuclease
VKLVIPGIPVPQGRPKFRRTGTFVQTYDPQYKDKNFMLLLLRREIEKIGFEGPLSGPLSVSFTFYLDVAESLAVAKQSIKLWNLDNCHKPDVDNLIKFWDFANGILWHDDRQIVKLTAQKKYSETPCTIIEINTIDTLMDKNSQIIVKLFSPNEMSELYHDAAIMANSIAEMKAAYEDDQLIFLPKISEKIIEFSKKYSKKLTKLAKNE